MIGIIGIIFIFLPETPWWLVSKGKISKAEKVLRLCNGRVEGYDVHEQLVRPPFPNLLSPSPLPPYTPLMLP